MIDPALLTRIKSGLCEEHELIGFMKSLCTKEQYDLLLQHQASFEDILNGRVSHEVFNTVVIPILKEWNERIGERVFTELKIDDMVGDTPSRDTMYEELARRVWAQLGGKYSDDPILIFSQMEVKVHDLLQANKEHPND